MIYQNFHNLVRKLHLQNFFSPLFYFFLSTCFSINEELALSVENEKLLKVFSFSVL